MQVQVNTDSQIKGSEELRIHVQDLAEAAIGRFRDRITWLHIHLTDENSEVKAGDNDKRCVMEAHVGGLKPVSVHHFGSNLDQAVRGAAAKLERSLDRTLGRLSQKKGRVSYGGDQP